MTIEQSTLSRLLAALTSLSIDDIPVAKYRYGSAGSLYPVQLYVQVRQDGVSGLSQGIYYLQPEKAQLYFISDEIAPQLFEQPEQAVALIFVAKDSAIQPIYGALAESFSAIEAGSMAELVRAQAQGYAIHSAPLKSVEGNAEHLAKICALEPQSRVLATMTLSPASQPQGHHFAQLATVKRISESSL